MSQPQGDPEPLGRRVPIIVPVHDDRRSLADVARDCRDAGMDVHHLHDRDQLDERKLSGWIDPERIPELTRRVLGIGAPRIQETYGFEQGMGGGSGPDLA